MQNSQLPAKWYKPFAADDANKVEIPVTTADPTRASQSLGFPPLTMQPPESGGVPPQGEDFNGAMNQVARMVWWAMAGGALPFDASFAGNANINGYPNGARVVSSDYLGTWISTAENNSINPDTVGTNWVPEYVYGVTALTSLTGGTITPTPVQAAKPRITLSGTLASNLIINLPTWLYSWTIVNNTTGAFSVTVKTAGGGGVVIPQNGIATAIRGDGTNILQESGNIAAATVTTQPLQAGSKGLTLLQAYTSAGTNTPTIPAGVFRIFYKVWGGGAGGGGGSTVAQSGNGGGSGGYCEGWMAVTPGQTVTAIVGANGTGGAATGIAGTNGGNSSLSNGSLTVTAGGGVAGAGGGIGGGGGGTATNGDVNIVGGAGTSAGVLSNSGATQWYSPPGGSAPLTGPSASGYGNGAGTPGKAPGGGGHSGTGGSSGAFIGGNGAPGAIYIWG